MSLKSATSKSDMRGVSVRATGVRSSAADVERDSTVAAWFSLALQALVYIAVVAALANYARTSMTDASRPALSSSASLR